MKSAGNETATKQPAPLTKEDLLRSPASFLALGFGTGLARIAPGTFGTLPGVLICALLAVVPVSAYVVLTVVIAVVGVWICDRASAELGVHDHGGIVWDEIAGYLVTMIAIPVGLITHGRRCSGRFAGLWRIAPVTVFIPRRVYRLMETVRGY